VPTNTALWPARVRALATDLVVRIFQAQSGLVSTVTRPKFNRSLLAGIALLACGLIASVVPARSDPADSGEEDALALQARIDEAARAIEDDPRLATVSRAQRRGLVQFVTGSMFFIALHELGHVHISETALPVLAREEDAADTFAVLALLQYRTALTHRMLADAAKSWFLGARRDEKEGTPLAFYDDHGLDRQRAYWIVCLMLGSDPAQFKDVADETGLPEEQRDNCVGNYSNASWSWSKVLEPYRRRPDQPKTTINVVYGPGIDARRVYERSFRSIRLLETVAEQAAERWNWRGPFTLEARGCGEANSQWNLPTRTLTVCYEMAEDFAQLYLDYGAALAQPPQASAPARRPRFGNSSAP